MSFKRFINEKTYLPEINDNSLGEKIILLLNDVSQFHIWHWLAKSGQKHVVLGEFYESLTEELDELTEMFIATGGVLKPISTTLMTEYSDELVLAKFAELRVRISDCIAMFDQPDFRSIQDELIEIQELIDKTMYKFDLE